MIYYLVDTAIFTDTLGRVLLQTLVDEVLAVLRHRDAMLLGVWEEHWLRFNQLIHFIVVWLTRVEWWEPNDHLIGQDTKGPPVHRERVSNLLQDLWRQVLRCTTKRVSLLILLQNLREPEVCQANVSIFSHQYIFWLQIPINNFLLVEMSECECNCHAIKLGSVL